MKTYVTISVPPDLLSQVTGELLRFTTDPNMVEVVHAERGQVIHADPLVTEAWLEYRRLKEEKDKAELAVEEPKPAPVKTAEEPRPAPAIAEPLSVPTSTPTTPPPPKLPTKGTTTA